MIFQKRKDGGKESTVTGYWLCEFKSLFSIVLLKFEGKSREAFHTHAFDSWNWIVFGSVQETVRTSPVCSEIIKYSQSLKPIFTSKDRYHKVDSDGTTWVFSIRGPWDNQWKEFLEDEGRERVLTHGRTEVCKT